MAARIESLIRKNEIILKMPEDLANACRGAAEDIQKELKLYLAINLYQKTLISIGKAAEISGLSRADFEIFLSDNQIPVSNLTIADVMADIEKMKSLKAAG